MSAVEPNDAQRLLKCIEDAREALRVAISGAVVFPGLIVASKSLREASALLRSMCRDRDNDYLRQVHNLENLAKAMRNSRFGLGDIGVFNLGTMKPGESIFKGECGHPVVGVNECADKAGERLSPSERPTFGGFVGVDGIRIEDPAPFNVDAFLDATKPKARSLAADEFRPKEASELVHIPDKRSTELGARFDVVPVCECDGGPARLGAWFEGGKGWDCRVCGGFIPQDRIANPLGYPSTAPRVRGVNAGI